MRHNLESWLASDKRTLLIFERSHGAVTTQSQVRQERSKVFDDGEFQRPHDLEETRLCAKQPVARCPAGAARLDQQIARISGLLAQLEDPTHGITDLLSALLKQARVKNLAGIVGSHAR